MKIEDESENEDDLSRIQFVNISAVRVSKNG